MKPLIYGYLRVSAGASHPDLDRLERGMRKLADAEGFCYATTFYEHAPVRGYLSDSNGAFDELTQELKRADAHHVAVPELAHFSPLPNRRERMLAHLACEADAQVWTLQT